MSYQGYLDVSSQAHLQGWAAEGLKPVPVTITTNGLDAGIQVEPNLPRPDLAPLGLPLVSGFTYTLPEPLSADDEVAVTFPDGTHLAGSPSRRHSQRLNQILDGIDLATGIGLELGPLDRPIVSKRKHDVRYVDHASRLDLLKKYQGTGSIGTVNEAAVAEVDYVWASGSLRDVTASEAFDYCIASHVIEHVPDMIAWLCAISECLGPNGLLNLAVPDKEKTFDWRRRTTPVSTFLASHLERRTTPSAGMIVDHVAHAVDVGAVAPVLWEEALACARAAEMSGDYVDVHCQVFTQSSFLEVMTVLSGMDLVPFSLRRFFPTRRDANEFIVSLQLRNENPEQRALSFQAQLGQI